MTRKEIYNWIVNIHKCEIIQLPEGRAMCVYFINRKTNGRATLNTPIDDRPLTMIEAIAICTSLGIPQFKEDKKAEDLIREVKKRHGRS